MEFTKTRDVKSPSRGTKESAGIDFYVPDDYEGVTLKPGQCANIPSGIKMILPPGQAGIFMNKSGVAMMGLQVGACVVDSDYRGEVHLNVRNVSDDKVGIFAGQKIVQMLIMTVELGQIYQICNEEYEQHLNTGRGTGGFGSTGKY